MRYKTWRAPNQTAMNVPNAMLHAAQDGVANLCLMVAITCEHQNASDDMMCKHLPMIFSPLFDVDDDDLLHPKRKLYEVVPFEQPAHFPVRPVGP
ncbi:MAG: hypothetical protein Q9200_000593 [Gallowayella weberi]